MRLWIGFLWIRSFANPEGFWQNFALFGAGYWDFFSYLKPVNEEVQCGVMIPERSIRLLLETLDMGIEFRRKQVEEFFYKHDKYPRLKEIVDKGRKEQEQELEDIRKRIVDFV